MACDEALLRTAKNPVLRVFRWASPWVSAGYFTAWHEAAAARDDLPICRRWTGGGVVVHEQDFTFALVAPRNEPWAQLRPEESYRLVHLALTEALRALAREAALFQEKTPGTAACFAGPVRYDVVQGTRKIAGGAQRRTKHGLLHQGSVQQTGLGEDFVRAFTSVLASETTAWIPTDTFEATVAELEREKYASEQFLRREER
jgi:lipoyl(octanoyl) transferase